MFRSSILLINTIAGLNHASATLLARADTSATGAITAAISVQQKAIEPTCVTEVVPVSSSCNIGVHTKRAEETDAASITLRQKAIAPSCSTSWITTTNCRIGVHPQPTDLTVTVVESSKKSDGSTVATTVTKAADASISAPASTETGSMGFVLTGDLRTSIVNVINKACPKKLKARDDIELDDLACALPESSFGDVLPEIEPLINDGLAFDAKAFAAFFASTVTEEQIRATLVTIFGTAVLAQAAGNAKLSLSSDMSAEIWKPLISNPPKAGTQATNTITSSSSAKKLAPTGLENDPNHGTITVNSAYTALLTKYFEGGALTTSSSSKLCSHGAQPGVLSGAADYCQCSGGKGLYPVSDSTYETTISGAKTTLTEPCPYTDLPASTIDAGATISPTAPKATSTSSTAAAVTSRVVPTQLCLPGAPAYSTTAVMDKLSSFCSDASKDSWTMNTSPTGVPINGLSVGGSQNSWNDVKPVKGTPEDQASQYLYLQVGFHKEDCKAGQSSADFRNTGASSGVGWCVDSFKALITGTCANSNKDWTQGGYYYNDCVEWYIGSHA